MLIYYFAWFLLLVPFGFKKKNQSIEIFENKYALYILVIMTLLIGLRGISVGADTAHYQYLYETSTRQIVTRQYEQGYYYCTYFLKKMGVDYQLFLVLVAAFSSGCLVKFYHQYSRNLAFSVFVFMTIGLLPMYMSGIRQVLAISLCLIALLFLENGRYIISAGIIMIASMFHISSLAFFSIFPLCRIRLSKKSTFLLIVISAMTSVFEDVLLKLAEMVLPEKYASIDIFSTYNINPLLIIIAVLIPLFCIVFDSRTEEDHKFSRSNTMLYLMSCINIVLTMLSRNNMFFSRVAYYFVHANSILISNVIFSQRKRFNRIIMVFVIGIVCALYFIISIPDGTMRIDKYRFFWQ